ncbi:amidohydrolase [Leekyejoonella antrihumi]|uniref:Peptidase M20 domain-containing protein 2 n=1 Tax=Leekyejoonella antrihumi TaxID=1660198 RepID=A0A563E491_9MICO|nr:amidohydrolase [Leekyejoonella antrihumi]TWP37337.1 M20 family metallopeptidase [Leekyejoonella antrihumi]
MTGIVGVPCDVLERVGAHLEEHRPLLVGLSHALHADPELGGEEVRAAQRISRLLGDAGFEREETPTDLPTSFCYRMGRSPMVVTVCVEYDALPGIGHACGHNVNAAAAIGAALSLGSLTDELDLSVKVLGTPAEETFGGKVTLINSGHFDDAALAMMAHASHHDTVGGRSLALCMWNVTFTGTASHAAAAPERGVNALDALVIAQTAIGLARQQLPPQSVVSTITTEGGSAVNVIPELARASIEMRSPSVDALQVIQARVRACLQAGAIATGCTMDITSVGNDFADLRQDATLATFYRDAMIARGRTVELSDAAVASTDMGNVSHLVPTIHPLLGYDVADARPHTAAFATYGTSQSADDAILDGAFGLAMTAARAAVDPAQRERLVDGATVRSLAPVGRSSSTRI